MRAFNAFVGSDWESARWIEQSQADRRDSIASVFDNAASSGGEIVIVVEDSNAANDSIRVVGLVKVEIGTGLLGLINAKLRPAHVRCFACAVAGQREGCRDVERVAISTDVSVLGDKERVVLLLSSRERNSHFKLVPPIPSFDVADFESEFVASFVVVGVR